MKTLDQRIALVWDRQEILEESLVNLTSASESLRTRISEGGRASDLDSIRQRLSINHTRMAKITDELDRMDRFLQSEEVLSWFAA